MKNPKIILTIAGSDSGGGAGIQGDLRTIYALNGYGVSVITALTAQNTFAVSMVNNIRPKMINKQIETIFDDFDVAAIKIGMLSNKKTIKVVSDNLSKRKLKIPIILDPVMISKSNYHLLKLKAVKYLIKLLFPLVTLITPNLQEAQYLSNIKIKTIEDAKIAAKKIIKMNVKAVLIKGLNQENQESVDLFYDGKKFVTFRMNLVNTENNHGTGCTLSSAIATNLANNKTLNEAIALAKTYLNAALKSNYKIGHGHGPINHFVLWSQKVECEINEQE